MRSGEPLLEMHDRRHHDPQREKQSRGDQRCPATENERQHSRGGDRDRERPAQPNPQIGECGATPAHERADAHQEERRGEQRIEDRVEVRRTHRDLAEVQRVEKQGIERAQQHAGHGDDDRLLGAV